MNSLQSVSRFLVLFAKDFNQMNYTEKAEMALYSYIELIELNPNNDIIETFYIRLIQANKHFIDMLENN